MVRTAERFKTPKDDQLLIDLEAHEECGRLIVWAGFQESVTHIEQLCRQQGWATLRIDGVKSYVAQSATQEICDSDDFLDAMDLSHPRFPALRREFPRIVTVANPGSGGMALTLTGSPTAIYFSNSFNGTDRFQSEDRGHRDGMDLNKGFTIKDYILLASDLKVLQNLRVKKKMQDMTMGELQQAFEEFEYGGNS
jgi:hypothetical protein